MSEEKFSAVCSCTSVVIFTAFVFLFLGMFLGRKGFSLQEVKDESYYQEECSRIYSLATDYFFCNKTAEKIKLKARLIREINSYNRETEDIEWKFRCPQRFTFYYLTGEEE